MFKAKREDFVVIIIGVIATVFLGAVLGGVFLVGYHCGRIDSHTKEFETLGTPFKDEAFIKTQFQQYVQ